MRICFEFGRKFIGITQPGFVNELDSADPVSVNQITVSNIILPPAKFHMKYRRYMKPV